MSEALFITRDLVSNLIGKRVRDCHKGDFGRLLVIASSRCYCGASLLCTLAAMRSGVGLCTLASIEEAVAAARVRAPEAITLPLKSTKDGAISFENFPLLLEKANSSTALLLGCGLSICEDTKKLVYSLIENVRVPIILDADGINLAAENIDILKKASAPIVLTPHLKEMSRLTNKSVAEIKADKKGVAEAFSKQYNVTLVLKDFKTVISNGKELFENTTGSPSMAKGGSGDMLSGMIGAFLAKGMRPIDAAVSAVYLHGLSGEIAANKFSEHSVLTTDMIELLGEAFLTL